MTENSSESLFRLLDESVIHWQSRKHGPRLAGVLVFDLRFVVRDPALAIVRERAAVAIDRLRALVPDDTYRWWWTREDTGPKRMPKNLPSAATVVAAAEFANDAFNFLTLDSEDPERDAPRHLLKVRYNPFVRSGDHPLGSFQFSVPLPWIETRPPGFMRDLFVELAALVQPRFGTAGYFLAMPLKLGTGLGFAREAVYPFLRRFPGVDSGEASQIAFILSDARQPPEGGMPSVNWLTAADDATLALCGGREAVTARFPGPDFQIYQHAAGLVIQAGPQPQLGDTEAGIAIPHYAQVAKVLRPARLVTVTGHINHSYGPGSRHSNEMLSRGQGEYLSRFDGMPTPF